MDMELETAPLNGEASVVKKPPTHDSEVIDLNQDLENSTSPENASNEEEEEEEEEELEDEDECDMSDYEDNEEDYISEEIEVDDDHEYMMKMQAQFDNADLPPGVEASLPWLNTSSTMVKPTPNEASSSSSSGVGPTEKEKNENSSEDYDEAMKKYQEFKHFDVVDDFSDHHYANMCSNGNKLPSSWMKRIQEEWKILEKDLPDMIFVRAVESKMELLRAILIGPQGTPYADGLFVFDIFFPSTYPDEPPMVYYYSGGLRLNPNLYDNGKVCLSLLNTWSGHTNEKWMPQKSTMLQVLVSIQALILNAQPFYNEPGYERTYAGPEGDKRSNQYSDDVFILSLKTMMYTLRRPPQHFEDLVTGHFRARAHMILSACRAYIDGAPVGSTMDGKVPEGVVMRKRSTEFPNIVTKMVNGLINNFVRYGAKDCDQFRIST